MSSVTTTPTSHDAHDGDGAHGGGGNGHDPHLAHHFDTPEQQQASGKLGMWVFLATEILMFGGLFCAYSVYRHNHPDVFEYAHQYLDKNWGAINTVVLITSSLTMAWGVRLAQLGKNKELIICLALTIVGGYLFMAIKSVEYKAKWQHHLGLGSANMYRPVNGEAANPPAHGGGHETDAHGGGGGGGEHGAAPAATTHAEAPKADAAAGAGHAEAAHAGTATAPAAPKDAHAGDAHSAQSHPTTAAAVAKPPAQNPEYFDPNTGTPDAANIRPVAVAPAGLAPKVLESARKHVNEAELGQEYFKLPNEIDKKRTYTFFQVYFLMTGLHGIHVLVGMALIYWILLRATPPSARKMVKVAGLLSVGLFVIYVGVLVHHSATTWVGVIVCALAALGAVIMKGPAPTLAGAADVGEFGPAYFAPVDIVGLYWHLVDLIWIFLFPLLYLIH